MTRFSLGMFVGILTGVVGAWIYTESGSAAGRETDRGEVIFRNTPIAD